MLFNHGTMGVSYLHRLLYGISLEPINIFHSKDGGGKIVYLFDYGGIVEGVTTGMVPLIGLGSD